MEGYLRSAASMLLLAAAAAWLAACGESPPDAAVRVTTADPIRVFAPEVRLDGRERWLPLSTTRFLELSGLEWADSDECLVRDVTASGNLWPNFSGPLPRLDPSRLGGGDAYRARSHGGSCDKPRGAVYASSQRTRPFDEEGRPPGLSIDEGFNLDIALDYAYDLRPSQDSPVTSGAIRVPTYYARTTTSVEGRPGVRLSYWLLFGGKQLGSSLHEGDWERIDVLLRQGGRPRAYTPVAVDLHGRRSSERVTWSEVDATGPRATHPVIALARGSHTPVVDDGCEDCLIWRTWSRLRDVRDEPWWGYAGGWGEIRDSDEASGPSGPLPSDLAPSG